MRQYSDQKQDILIVLVILISGQQAQFYDRKKLVFFKNSYETFELQNYLGQQSNFQKVNLGIQLFNINLQMSESRSSRRQLLEIQPSETTQITDYENDPHIYSNHWEFILSIVGLTVGFGSFWRFPYLIYKNGGGAFFIPYFICLFVVGIPLLYLETAVGQMHRRSIPFILAKIHPSLKMVGIMFLLNSLHLSSVYNVLLAYSYRLIFTAFNVPLPFQDEPITDSKYFNEVILQKSSSIEEFEAINPFLFILYVASLLICHQIVKNGVKASGNIILVTATSPFILIFILLVRGFFLDGAIQGLKYLFVPDWSKLLQGQIWIDSLIQVFYQMSVGLGTLYGICSLNPKRQILTHSILYVPIGLLLCGLMSASTIFIYLSHFSRNVGVPLDHPDLKLAGPQLSFNVFPKALTLLPFSNLWVLIFFITMVLLGIDSLFGMIQALYTYVRDEFNHLQNHVEIFGIRISQQFGKYIVLGMILVGCPSLTSHAGIYYLQFYDYYISNIPFLLVATLQLYIFVYLFKFQQLQAVIVRYTKKPTPFIIRYFLQSKILIILLGSNCIIAVFQQIMSFRKYSIQFYLIGWAITLYPTIMSYLYFRKRWTCFEDLKLTFKDIENPPTYF